jgi:hypothetical protein
LLIDSAYDGRFVRLPFTLPGEWIDRHGTVGGAALADRAAVRPLRPHRRTAPAAAS